jgi:hypothetical protein
MQLNYSIEHRWHCRIKAWSPTFKKWMWLNRTRHRFYSAIGNPGVIEVIDTRKLVVDERVKTEEGAHTFTFDEKRQRLYVFLPKSCVTNIYKEA